MPNSIISNKGYLKVSVFENNTTFPVKDALIEISDAGEPDKIIETLSTDANGISDTISLPTPKLLYSMSPSDNQPYALYNIKIRANSFSAALVSNVQLYSNETGLQNVSLTPGNDTYDPIVIPPHTLYEYYPPKIAETEVKPVSGNDEIVLSRVVIPETIVVHDGAPSDSTAKDYYVPYIDYIKNVASSEIYATWPKEAIKANVYAIMSFTLNRVYTEWYRNKNYDFTITSSTAFDQKWIYGQTIYSSISEIVDEVFTSFIQRPNIKQPLFTQYCDGKRVTCPNWMSQWGSKSLADDGLSALQILKYYYGNDIFINSADVISGIPSSFPGTLSIGSSGEKVKFLQDELNTISKSYPAIPKITADGIYGSATANAVRIFQGIFNLSETGVTDYATWYKISQIYVGVTKIAE